MKQLRRFSWLAAICTAVAAYAQEPNMDVVAPVTNSATERHITTRVVVLTEQLQAPREDVLVGTNYRVSGPLAGPIKAIKSKKFLEAPVRLLQAVNPLATTVQADSEARRDHLSTRSWVDIVGWHPGALHLDDPITHEPEMSLLAISRTPKP
jgi:hypothetical protein